MVKITFAELQTRVAAVLQKAGMEASRAELSARLTAEADRDGVRTHGIARLPRFLEMCRNGAVALDAVPERVASFGALERWRGHRGPGNLAAYAAMARACELAKEHGLGLVALADTTHWMRAGSYGWQAADAGCASMCWTNTMPNLPAWGSSEPTLGNNPLVMAAPRSNGEHLVLDFAMSQFSYGTLAKYRQRGEPLPFPGGWDAEGELTTDPAAIEATYRALPIGLWKGSGLSFVLDALAAMLSGGRLTAEVAPEALQETGLSQVFLAIAPQAVGAFAEMDAIATRAVEALHGARPLREGERPRYPGESTLRLRKEAMAEGVAVEDATWAAFVGLE
ncbi:MAG: 3-dehydro-L-gulonate 2-dehydrogenase [Acidobacteriaceae bacterium]|nr:3-dehydro-L-gulonate 2-dehydrogenase [Acidobacteriaceae bacterium]